MKSGGVFLGGLATVLATNLMLIGVCSSAPSQPMPAAVPPPLPAEASAKAGPIPVIKIAPKPVELSASFPLGLFVWGCGAHRSVDLEGALPLPICPPIRG